MRWLVLCALVGCVDPNGTPSNQPEGGCADIARVTFTHGGSSFVVQTLAIAEGGRANLALECILPDLPGRATWDLPSIATASNDAVTAFQNGSMLSIHGVHQGSASVAITASDGGSYGSISIEVAPADHLAFGSENDDIPTNVEVAFAKEFGTLDEVKLASSAGVVLVDDDMVVTPPAGSTRSALGPAFFDIAAMPLGDTTIEVDAGGSTLTAPFSVVDHADAIALVNRDLMISSAPNSSSDVCFAATLGTKFVAGLLWSYTLEGAEIGGSNCDHVGAVSDVNHDGKVTVGTSAGGVSAQIDVPVH